MPGRQYAGPGEFLVRAGEKSLGGVTSPSETGQNCGNCMAPFLVSEGAMTDKARHQLSLLLALAGVLMMIGYLSGNLWLSRITRNMPAFEKSSPAIPDWPRHSWSPVG
jgi:hypothetical protein